jgi:hypothetical protein
MYEIYKSAFKVAVCLTTHGAARNLASRESDRAITCIEQVYNNVPKLDIFLQSSYDASHNNTFEHNWDVKEERNCWLYSYIRKAVEDKEFALGWLDVSRMVRMPWFSRAWVRQINSLTMGVVC